MAAMQVVHLKDEKLTKKFMKMFNAVVYQFPVLDNAWAYESDKTDLALYFPEGTTEADVEALVAKSIKERKDFVYEVVKNAELPAAVKHHRKMIDKGYIF